MLVNRWYEHPNGGDIWTKLLVLFQVSVHSCLKKTDNSAKMSWPLVCLYHLLTCIVHLAAYSNLIYFNNVNWYTVYSLVQIKRKMMYFIGGMLLLKDMLTDSQAMGTWLQRYTMTASQTVTQLSKHTWPINTHWYCSTYTLWLNWQFFLHRHIKFNFLAFPPTPNPGIYMYMYNPEYYRDDTRDVKYICPFEE